MNEPETLRVYRTITNVNNIFDTKDVCMTIRKGSLLQRTLTTIHGKKVTLNYLVLSLHKDELTDLMVFDLFCLEESYNASYPQHSDRKTTEESSFKVFVF